MYSLLKKIRRHYLSIECQLNMFDKALHFLSLISLIEGCCSKGSYEAKSSKW